MIYLITRLICDQKDKSNKCTKLIIKQQLKTIFAVTNINLGVFLSKIKLNGRKCHINTKTILIAFNKSSLLSLAIFIFHYLNIKKLINGAHYARLG